jgi:type I restriction enzyme S subunit
MKLLQYFKELTIRPKNAKELKGLILQLAIQGKLTANWRTENPDIKSASELLKKIKKERVQLIKEKKVRKGKPIQPIKKEEKYLEIPQNWVWTRIIEAGNIFNGNSVNKSIKAAKYEGLEEGLPYLGTKDINYGFEDLNYDNGVKIPFDEPKFKIAHNNTALICSEGGSAGKKCGITKEDICFGNKLYAVEQYGDIESVYILSIYKTPIFFDVFQSNMTGIIGGVSINSFGEIPIPLPPLEEQKEIVKVVETLFKEVEQLEQLTVKRIGLKEDFVTSALNQLTTNNANQEWSFLQDHFKSFFNETTNIKKLRETVLQLAVQGELTADWRVNNPNKEDATILLKRIQKEKAQLIKEKKIKKERHIPPIKEERNLSDLPKGWTWCRMGQVGNIMNSAFVDGPFGSSINTKKDYIESGIPVLRMVNVKPYRFKGESMKYISEEKYQSFLRHGVIAGDILFSKVGAGIGESCIVPNTFDYGMLSTTGISRIRVGEVVSNEYLCHFINGHIDYFKSLSQNSAQPFLNMTQIKSVPFPLPPLEEQQAIVQKVNALMGLCDSLEQEVQQSQEQSAQLMQSCLREVFEGKEAVAK